MEKILKAEEQKKIVREQFKKLKDEFLTKEQSSRVYLLEFSNDWWFMKRGWSYGFTHYNYKKENSPIYVSIRYFFSHERLINLLETIAHEFARVYLIFINPKYESKEHEKWKEFFLNYLIDINFHINRS